MNYNIPLIEIYLIVDFVCTAGETKNIYKKYKNTICLFLI